MKHKGRYVTGILLLDKPGGISSNRALQRVKRLFNARKAGHTGSLDPLATGLLPICLGEATKVTPYLLNARKQYLATIGLGIETDTADSDGQVMQAQPVPELQEAELIPVLASFLGESEQIPPMYSAISVDGRRLYKLAREGKTVEREPRKINIFELQLLKYSHNALRIRVTCSKGTYIRSLAVDIGRKIGCGGHITALHRTGVDPFFTSEMITLEELQALAQESEEKLDATLLQMDAAIKHLDKLILNQEDTMQLVKGLTVMVTNREDQLIRLYLESDRFLGVGVIKSNQLKGKRLLDTGWLL